jgi:hypothetical protein
MGSLIARCPSVLLFDLSALRFFTGNSFIVNYCVVIAGEADEFLPTSKLE